LGSAAVIMQRRLEDTLAGQATPDDFGPAVWNTWNAKSPAAQRDDALTADTALLAHIEAVPPDARDRFSFAMGPMTFDYDQFLGLRLNEHAFHTWDIEVAADPDATIPEPVAALVEDRLRAGADLHPGARADLADILCHSGRITEAIQVLRRGVDLGESDSCLPLAKLYDEELGDLDAAEATYRAGIDSGDNNCHHNLARLFEEQDRLDEARHHYELGAAGGDALAQRALIDLDEE
jgi:tetratricopeptide (TPR) repeat protein